MKLYTALDVSLRSGAICVVNEHGEVQYETKVEADVQRIVTCLRSFSAELKVVGFEAGTLTQYLTYGLQAAGFEVVCMEARQVNAALAAMRNKTDKNDARGYPQILRTGWYSRVHVKSLERQQIRVFLARALLPFLDSREMLYRTYLKLDNEVKAIVRHDRICQQFMSVPGVGAITALTFKAAVDDPHRFKRSRTVAAHFGLTPRRYQSGETDNPGRISKAGDPDVRCALYVAAHS